MCTPAVVDLDGAVMLRRELLESGYTDRHIRAMLKAGLWVRVRHGTYVEAALWSTLSPTDRHRVLLRAVLKRAHPSTVASHVSAAVERGLPTWGIPLEEVHTTRTDGKSGRREAGVVHHRGALAEEDVETVNGVRVTPVARCAVEIMSQTTVEPALVTINAMLHAGLMTDVELRATVAELKSWPETLTSHVVLRLCEAAIESVGESRAWFLFWKQGLPRPIPQVTIRDENGDVVARLDFAWPELGVWLEFDGREKYRRFRREDESLDDFLMREKQRQDLVGQLTGWTCIRISWADLQEPELLAMRIRRILDGRRPLGA